MRGSGEAIAGACKNNALASTNKMWMRTANPLILLQEHGIEIACRPDPLVRLLSLQHSQVVIARRDKIKEPVVGSGPVIRTGPQVGRIGIRDGQ